MLLTACQVRPKPNLFQIFFPKHIPANLTKWRPATELSDIVPPCVSSTGVFTDHLPFGVKWRVIFLGSVTPDSVHDGWQR